MTVRNLIENSAVDREASTAQVLFFAPFTCGSLTVSRAVSAADDTAVPYPGDYLHAYVPPSGEGPPAITAPCMMLSIFLRSSSERSMSAAGTVPSMWSGRRAPTIATSTAGLASV